MTTDPNKLRTSPEIPLNLITPDEIDTQLGKLTFTDGAPSSDTVQKILDNYDFVRALPSNKNLPVFLLKTAGDYHSVNNSASHSIKKILARKGYDPFYDEIIVMPVNWLIAYDDQLNRQIVEKAPDRVRAAALRQGGQQHHLARERHC